MTLSILGLYSFDKSIFDGLQLPDGIDRDTVIDNILIEFAELEFLYPSAPFAKKAISIWSKKMIERWTEFLTTTKYVYDPIENYNRIEDWNDVTNRTGSNTATSGGSSTSTASGGDTTTVSGETKTNVAAFNSSEFQPTEKSADSSTTTTQLGNTTTNTANSDTKLDSSENVNTVRSGRTHGNIGTTTTQEMIMSQREVINFNIYDLIIKDFGDRFCIGVW